MLDDLAEKSCREEGEPQHEGALGGRRRGRDFDHSEQQPHENADGGEGDEAADHEPPSPPGAGGPDRKPRRQELVDDDRQDRDAHHRFGQGLIDHEPELDDDSQPHPTLRDQTEPDQWWDRVVSCKSASREIASSHFSDQTDPNINQCREQHPDIGKLPVGAGQHEK